MGMSFLKQDRPGKVKEIYRALKRDHPGMPAEMKARISARQGKPGSQKQGPPYKGPITPWKEKTSMIPWDSYYDEMMKISTVIRGPWKPPLEPVGPIIKKLKDALAAGDYKTVKGVFKYPPKLRLIQGGKK